jgi:hypothetical protein
LQDLFTILCKKKTKKVPEEEFLHVHLKLQLFTYSYKKGKLN